jgi:hypothetical protein
MRSCPAVVGTTVVPVPPRLTATGEVRLKVVEVAVRPVPGFRVASAPNAVPPLTELTLAVY